MSNLKQIGLAIMMYVEDDGEYLPPVRNEDSICWSEEDSDFWTYFKNKKVSGTGLHVFKPGYWGQPIW